MSEIINAVFLKIKFLKDLLSMFSVVEVLNGIFLLNN